MIQVFRDNREMLAHVRHKDIEVKHKAVKVEELKVEKPKKKKKKKEE